MKKTILTLLTAGAVAAGLQSAKAGHEWTTAEKVFTGLAAATFVAGALTPHTTYVYTPAYYPYSAAPVVYSTPAYVAPVPRAYVPAPAAVYVAPSSPVVVYRRPAYATPVPAVSLNFRFGGHRHFYHHAHW